MENVYRNYESDSYDFLKIISLYNFLFERNIRKVIKKLVIKLNNTDEWNKDMKNFECKQQYVKTKLQNFLLNQQERHTIKTRQWQLKILVSRYGNSKRINRSKYSISFLIIEYK